LHPIQDGSDVLSKEEIKFIGDLGTKYGPGKLDPFTLIYKIEENEIA
jgi:hypothetical protein